MKLKVLVIVATYNERDSLPRLVECLEAIIPDSSILIIDDDSPDGTGNWAQTHAKTRSEFDVVIRKGERGLGSATVTGIRWGLEREFEFLVTLDADLSHPPERIPEMLELLQANPQVGVVIGSRYVPGGRIEGWPLKRKIVSRLTNWLGKYWLGLKVNDSTGAFRVYRSSELRKLNLDTIKAQGYGYLEELLFRLQRLSIGTSRISIDSRCSRNNSSSK